MTDRTDLFHPPAKLRTARHSSALRLRLGDIEIEHRSVVAELRDAMANPLEEPEPRRRRGRRRD